MNRRSVLPTLFAAVLASGCGAGHGDAPGAAAAPEASRAAAPRDRQIVFYRNPMGLADTSPVPKKDAMGMDYVPVYAGEEAEAGRVRISADKLQKLGVRTEAASRHALTRTLRVAGILQVDERRQWAVSPRFEGWITVLHVGTTGAAVRRGDALLEVYSPELVGAEEDFRVATAALTALQDADHEARAGAEALVRVSVERLRNLGIAESDLPALRAATEPRRSLVLRAEHDGVVLDKAARVGMRFTAGEPLYQLADLAKVWMVVSVAEQDLALIHVGQAATASTVAYPGRTFPGQIAFISPILQAETHTAQVRIELANPGGLLKPAMFGSVDLPAGRGTVPIAVPDSSILDTGTRQLVLVDSGGGTFEPREVRVGARGDGYTEILEGLQAGELVVVNGNFLIDAESNLRSATAGAPGPRATAAARPGATTER